MIATNRNISKSADPKIFKSRMGVIATATLYITLATISIAFCQAPYYIKTGNGITKVEHSDPAKLKVREWQVRLYKNGAPTGGDDHWGIISANTAAEVMHKLKNDQDFELRYNSWAGKGRVRDEVLTNFNPLGPIAILDEPEKNTELSDNNARQEALDNVLDKYDQVKELYDGYQDIEDILAKNPRGQTPFDGFGNVFKEYTDNLQEAFRRVNDLKYQLQNISNLSLNQINFSLKEIDANVEVARHNSAYIRERLHVERNTNSAIVPAVLKEDTDDILDRFSDDLLNSFSSINPQDPEAMLQQINRITRTMAKSLSENGDSDERLDQLSELLISMSETDDIELMTSYLQKVIELITEISDN